MSITTVAVVQAVSAATSEHQQLSQLQTQVGKLATVLQQLLASVRSGGTVSGMLDAKPGANPVKVRDDSDSTVTYWQLFTCRWPMMLPYCFHCLGQINLDTIEHLSWTLVSQSV